MHQKLITLCKIITGNRPGVDFTKDAIPLHDYLPSFEVIVFTALFIAVIECLWCPSILYPML